MNPLEQDKQSLLIDLQVVSLQVKACTKELEDIQLQIVGERERLAKIQSTYEPSKKIHEDTIEELKKNIAYLDGERMKLESEIFELKDKSEKANKAYEERIKIQTQEYADITGKVAKLESDKWTFEKDTRKVKEEYDKQVKKTEEIKILNQELKVIEKEISLKMQILHQVDKDLAKTQKREDDINAFAQQLSEREKKVTERERIVDVMEKRITPKYQKIFKQFSNI